MGVVVGVEVRVGVEVMVLVGDGVLEAVEVMVGLDVVVGVGDERKGGENAQLAKPADRTNRTR